MKNCAYPHIDAWMWLLIASLAALGNKAALLAAGAFPFNSDEAIVALMARHILQGERPVFFYGQAYMGSLDALFVAAGFRAFGEQVWVIRAVQAALYLGTLLTTAALGKAVFSDRRVGLVAAWFLAIPTVNVTLYTTVSLGGYGEMLLIGNLILLCALAFGRYPWQAGLRKDILCLAFGFLVGLGLWAFGLTIVYSLPAILYGIFRAWQQRYHPIQATLSMAARRAGWFVLGGIAGSAPWWGYARATGLGSLLAELGGSAIAGVEGISWPAQLLQHMVNLVLFGGTVITGMRPPWDIRWLAWPLMPLALAIWFGTLAYSSRRLLQARSANQEPRFRFAYPDGFKLEKPSEALPEKAFPGQSAGSHPGEWLLAGVGLTLALGFILTPFGADPSGRYFLPLAIVLALFMARAVVDWRERWGLWVYALVGLLLLFNQWGTLQLARLLPPGLSTQIDISTQIDHRFDATLVEFLVENGETRGYTTYWAAYPLAFLSGERLIFQPRLPYHLDFRHTTRDDRYAPYADQVASAGRVAYITVRHAALDARLESGLRRLGVGFREAWIGDYHVYYDLGRAVRPEELGL